MKKLISAVLCLSIVYSLCVPAMAVSVAEKDSKLSPGGVLMEGEEWAPASNGGIVPMGDEDECGHNAPAGYRFVNARSGNTNFDVAVSTTGSFIVGLILSAIIPGGLPISVAYAVTMLEGLSGMTPPNQIYGDYLVMTYECMDPGIYPYIYWHHISCTFDYDGDGIAEYACETEMEYALLPK